MEPTGDLATTLLSLLRDAGLPAAVVAAVGTAIALYQFATNLGQQAYVTEHRVVQAFASSSRRVRAYGLFVISHAVAVTVTIGVATQLLSDDRITDALGVSAGTALFRVQAGIAAYFLVVDWWAITQGDQLPVVVAFLLGLAGGLLIIGFGGVQAVEAGSWVLMLPWVVAAFVWFRSFGWASSTGSGLARAVQGA